jgi:septin family protein
VQDSPIERNQSFNSDIRKTDKTDNSKASANRNIRLCFVGERYVGKTAFILSLADADDLEPMQVQDRKTEETKQSRRSLMSPDTVTRQYKLPISSQPIKAIFWDQANDSNMFPRSVAQSAHGVIMVVDVTNR